MSDSILNSTKKVVGLAEDYDAFDVDILMQINSVFATLHQLGIGPADGFEIEDDEPTWESYTLGVKPLNAVKRLMWATVRLNFDPPGTSFAINALKDQIAEDTWRLSVYRDTALATTPVDVVEEVL